jgi:threonine synthase
MRLGNPVSRNMPPGGRSCRNGKMTMRYRSTRGEAPVLGFSDALLAGLARDGGLYVPKEWPSLSAADIRKLRGLPYPELAVRLLTPFLGGEIDSAAFSRIAKEAYATFRHPAVCPIVQTGPNRFILELFHGPTLAFKDVAMQLLARLMDHVLAERGKRATIVGATSGDTGGAAIEAFAGRDRTDIFILFPHGRVSPVQQRQMTTSTAQNVHALAIEGNFDDCQALVKEMFNDHPFRDSVSLSGVNSINWARIMAQIVYYFSSALSLGAPDRPVSFTVPTGNFGDIFAGYAAKRMGLPVEKLVIATNDNDILARTLETGVYETRGVIATTSPSMDIQVSSNFERLLFEATDCDAATVRRYMSGLAQSGSFAVEPATMGRIREDFAAGRSTMAETARTIRNELEASGYLTDPHTATAVHVADSIAVSATPMVVLATAHPAKFPAAVEAAAGVEPLLPSWLSDLMGRKERFTVLPSSIKMMEEYVSRHTRAAR